MKQNQQTPEQQYVPQQAGQAVPVEEKKNFSELAVSSFILGLLGIILPWFGPLAVVLGIGGLMQIKRVDLRGKALAIIGIVLGVIMTIVAIAAIIWGIGALEQYLDKFGGAGTLMEKAKG